MRPEDTPAVVYTYLAKCEAKGINATFLCYGPDSPRWSVREFATVLAAVEAPTLKEAYEEYVRRMEQR